MVKWDLDKQSKVPLYLQLKDKIRHSITSGAVQENEQLPGVNVLAEELGINFETVRKAYKELEREGLISIKRGKGTFVTFLKGHIPMPPAAGTAEIRVTESVKGLIKELISELKDIGRAREIIDNIFEKISQERANRYLIYTEYASQQLSEISRQLAEYLNVRIQPVGIDRLENELQDYVEEGSDLLGIITTGFYVADVQKIIGERPIDIHVVISNMSPLTRKKIEALNREKDFGFVCRDQETLALFRDQIKAELPDDLKITGCTLKEEVKLKKLLKSIDVVLVTPRVLDDIKKMAPPHIFVINIFDHIDPMSMSVIKEKIMEKGI